MTKQEIFQAIVNERDRQDSKWGAARQQSGSHWMNILTEEIGEVAECVCKTEVAPIKMEEVPIYLKNMDKELIQCAAVIFAWLESKEGILVDFNTKKDNQ